MTSPGQDTRFATIALAGKPNSGKSTLLNALIGQKLAITSSKPQSTRRVAVGVHTEGDLQLVFVDPPGLLNPRNELQVSMLLSATEALSGADAVIYTHPITEGTPPALETILPAEHDGVPKHVATVLTKADVLADCDWTDCQTEQFLVSAKTGQGIQALLEWCGAHAKPGPFRYDPEDVSTQSLRFFTSELVREAAFELLDQELPYAIAVEIDEFRETESPVYISAVVYVERESQKGIVIGREGRTIKALGRTARVKIEELVAERVYLDLRVKVIPKWRSNPNVLRMLGLPMPRDRARN
ncbi:MAG: GTPase Era [Gemmatimonadales bacterium]